MIALKILGMILACLGMAAVVIVMCRANDKGCQCDRCRPPSETDTP